MSNTIRFVLNGEPYEVSGVSPNLTVLRWLRDHARKMGTKEGCAEGDCGACTVAIGVPDGRGGLRRRTENACIRLAPQLHGLSVETIEHLGAGQPDGLHPVQRELIDRHGSQCGFCTPGIAVRLAVAAENGECATREGAVDALSGNLCRCTGYGPIVDAAVAASGSRIGGERDVAIVAMLNEIAADGSLIYRHDGRRFDQPRDLDELAALYADHPDATLLAGGTDVGLWIAKLHKRIDHLIEVNRVEGFDRIEETADGLRVHGAATHEAFRAAVGTWHPDLDELMRRFAGHQTREVGTVCGNVANGSPIGDLNPTLIALGATVNLRRGERDRSVPIAKFFIDYGKQDREPGELVASIDVPRLREGDLFHCSKVSKRFESDISAVLGSFHLTLDGEMVREARLAFGGMAATPKRAPHAEAALRGRPFTAPAVEDAAKALASDFTPLNDMRASAEYRLTAAGNLLRRFLREQGEVPTLRALDAVEPA